MSINVNPFEVARQVTLALVLEPLSDKEGCTTRSQDLNENIRLQHLQASAINSSKFFYQLAERVKEQGGQPKVHWDLALAALKDSSRNIANSKKIINQGLIAVLIELALSGLITEGDGIKICKAVPHILKSSSEKDVHFRTEYLKLSWTTSTRKHKKEFPHHLIDAKNLFDYWSQFKEVSENTGHISGAIWANEFMQGFPIMQDMYNIAYENIGQGLLKSLEISFDIGIKNLKSKGHGSAGFVADYVAGVAFLLLRDMPDREIIV